jgi:hypothetical protein
MSSMTTTLLPPSSSAMSSSTTVMSYNHPGNDNLGYSEHPNNYRHARDA